MKLHVHAIDALHWGGIVLAVIGIFSLVRFIGFTERDVVRHTLVQRIVRAYERYNETIGAGRQLTLKLSEPGAETANGEARAEAASAAETAPRA